ncbi:MAG: hypothetical protein LBN20_01295 [Endomicrobium sp.]|jgi:hypothetical protein|nr:hypothetical protein [Endomicrobium sp.]
MAIIKCPKCGNLIQKGNFAAWQIILAICFFPVGLVSFLAGRGPTTCHHCNTTFNNEHSSTNKVVITIFSIVGSLLYAFFIFSAVLMRACAEVGKQM